MGVDAPAIAKHSILVRRTQVPRYIDITGKRFGRLLVLQWHSTKQKSAYWECECVCGTVKTIRGSHLRDGRIVSCRCCQNVTHGKTDTPTYYTWSAMIQRCGNPKNPSYCWYGARGIKVCRRWLKFENFLADMGEKPSGTSIDRVNNNKGYSPGNCRWATPKEQTNNQRPRSK